MFCPEEVSILPQMIINKQEASAVLKDFILNTWCQGNRISGEEIDIAPLKMQQLFQSPEKQQQLLQQIMIHQPFELQHFLNFVFGKEVRVNYDTQQPEGIYAFQIGKAISFILKEKMSL